MSRLAQHPFPAPRVHRLKTVEPHFTDVVVGRKGFEVRINDRDYRVDDVLILEEWLPKQACYTGSFAIRRVTYMLVGGDFGIAKNACVMGIEPHALTDGIESRTDSWKACRHYWSDYLKRCCLDCNYHLRVGGRA